MLGSAAQDEKYVKLFGSVNMVLCAQRGSLSAAEAHSAAAAHGAAGGRVYSRTLAKLCAGRRTCGPRRGAARALRRTACSAAAPGAETGAQP